MYNYELGTWTEYDTDDFKEHFETTYYLKYNIEKAIYSLDKKLIIVNFQIDVHIIIFI